jgi:hypothetical protein
MPQREVQGGRQLGTAVEIYRSHPLNPLPAIFCGQVLAFQYFGQVKPSSAPVTYSKQIFYKIDPHFFDPDSRRRVPHS